MSFFSRIKVSDILLTFWCWTKSWGIKNQNTLCAYCCKIVERKGKTTFVLSVFVCFVIDALIPLIRINPLKVFFKTTFAPHLLLALRQEIPDMTLERIKFLDFRSDDLYPVTFLTATVLEQLWLSRTEKKRCTWPSIRAQVESEILLLRKRQAGPGWWQSPTHARCNISNRSLYII